MGYYIGVDLGGTNMRAAVVNSEDGSLSKIHKIETQAHLGHDHVLERMAGFLEELIADSGTAKSDISGIGIGLPGSMNVNTGVTTFMTNLPDHWIQVPVSDIMSQKLKIPTFILNDVRAITWGELVFGAGKGCQSMACYALGTGIGGGVVINGNLLMGITGQAGELGHQVVEPNGNRCNCGGQGCLETYASGPAIRSAAIKAVAHGATTIIGELVNFDLNQITPQIVAEAAAQGDEISKGIFETAGHYLGIAISNTITTIEPERIVICGGVAAAGELLFEPIRQTLKKRCFVVPLENIQIVPGALGDNAGIIGNSMWAEHKVGQTHLNRILGINQITI